MSVATPFSTSVHPDSPTDGARQGTKQVSDFITVGSLANFSVMSTAIASGWAGLRQVSSHFDGKLTPFLLCMTFALLSVVASKPGKDLAKFGPAAFIALINGLTLFSAVLGANNLTTS